MSSSSLVKRIKSLAVLTLLVAVLGVIGATAQDEIKIGVVLPTTGAEAKAGQYQKEGVELAIKQINATGGIYVKEKKKKLPIKEVFYDDGTDQAKSSSLAERAMTSDNVTAMIGGYSTPLGEAESVMPDRHQTPWITAGAAATSIFSRGYKYTFGTLSPIFQLGFTTAESWVAWWTRASSKKASKWPWWWKTQTMAWTTSTASRTGSRSIRDTSRWC